MVPSDVTRQQIHNVGKAFALPGWHDSANCDCGKFFGQRRKRMRYIRLEGKDYALDCDCWHERAKRIIRWLSYNAEEVAAYLRLEKKRQQVAADAAPVVD